MKTYLVWNVASAFSEALCRALALGDQRLLLCGSNLEQLAQLDEQLAQNELHRYSTPASFSAAYEWVVAEHLGFDGCVAFAPASASSDVAWAAELLSAFGPLLRRSKKAKRVLLVMDGTQPVTANGETTQDAAHTYSEALLRPAILQLARQLAPKGVVLNAVIAPRAAVTHLESTNGEPEFEAFRDPNLADFPGRAISSTRAAQCCVTLLDGFSPSLTGQTLSLALDCT